ncbi:phage tail protein [Laribacter hongkongensis]|uniref:phage tail protein n=1 Tax=Laribacter hongkongensis TaxID=168471 RepID=UPI001EFD216E|nr:phage tail protein [Laribacter hongkongensis]MCG9106308.1 phage tail protein [Laribacter hongkongensis]
MPATYYCLLTRIGEAKLAKATALGTRLAITHLAVGDGGGSVPQPEPDQTALKHEVRRGLVNELKVDPLNANQIIIEQVIPEEAGGWWIREVGAFDADGDLIAVGNCPESYKPVLAEGSGRTQVIRMVLIVSSTDAVTLKIDPSVVLATKQHVTETVAKAVSDHVKQPDPHPQYATDTELSELSRSLSDAISRAISDHVGQPDPHAQYATDEELSALSTSLNEAVRNALAIARSKVATVNGVGPDPSGNVVIDVQGNSNWTFVGGAPGWARDNSTGLTLQWGFDSSPFVQTVTSYFPRSFTTAYSVVIGSQGGSESTCRVTTLTATYFQSLRHYTGSGGGHGGIYWLAVGHS